MQINVKILEVSDPVVKKKGKGRWNEITLKYEGDKGEQTKRFQDFANQNVYDALRDLEPGFSYNVEIKKEGDYWNWVDIDLNSRSTESPEKASKQQKDSDTSKSKGSDVWAAKNQLDKDRFEFEKEKQILIIRQSMIGAAVEYHKGTEVSQDEVLTTAGMFVDYVLGGNIKVPTDREDDVE